MDLQNTSEKGSLAIWELGGNNLCVHTGMAPTPQYNIR